MPTGYTEIIDEKLEACTFEEFVWRCARGMGAFIMMRDEPMNAPIPERFEPETFYRDAVEKHRRRILELESMTDEQAAAAALVEREEEVARNAKWRADATATRGQYWRIRDLVAAWQPPTQEHAGLKTFMLEQLATGAPNSEWVPEAPPNLALGEWRRLRLERARKDLEFAEAEWQKSVERTESRNRWIAALRASVPPPAPNG